MIRKGSCIGKEPCFLKSIPPGHKPYYWQYPFLSHSKKMKHLSNEICWSSDGSTITHRFPFQIRVFYFHIPKLLHVKIQNIFAQLTGKNTLKNMVIELYGSLFKNHYPHTVAVRKYWAVSSEITVLLNTQSMQKEFFSPTYSH